jgi:uncharacterized protein DUF6286
MRKMVNRILGVILALALIVGAALVIVEVIAVLVGAQPVLVDWQAALDWARRTRWDATGVKTAGVVLLVVGLALTLFEVWPSRARRLPIDSGDPSLEVAVTRRGLAQDLKVAVGEVDGVTPRRIEVRPGRVRVWATARGSGEERRALREAVMESVGTHLDQLRLRRRPRLAVTVDGRS